MPLLNHFQPPLRIDRPWESFHSAWANAFVGWLNQKVLPERYWAIPQVHVGDADTFEVQVREEQGETVMTQIILDASVSSQLQNITQPTELCDPSGRVLGRFVPLIDLAEWEPASPDVSEEELDGREQSEDWYTTEQVLAHLKSLEKQ